MSDVPTYIGLGKQDNLLGAPVRSLAQSIGGRADCQFEEFDPCEHLMIVADALTSAYRFFDAH